MADYLKEYKRWLEYEDLDAEMKRALEEMADNEDEKKMYFFIRYSLRNSRTPRYYDCGYKCYEYIYCRQSDKGYS